MTDRERVACGSRGILGAGLEVVVLSRELRRGASESSYFAPFGLNSLARGSPLLICDWGVSIGLLTGSLPLGRFIVGNLGGESLPAGVDVPPRRDDGRKLVAVDMNDGNGLLVGCSGTAKVVSPIMDDELGQFKSVLCCTTDGEWTYSQEEGLPIIPRPVFPPIPSTSGVNNPPLLPAPAWAW